jgi:hypothetical protein
MPVPDTNDATTTQARPWANATMNKRSPRMWMTMPIILGRRSPIRCTNRPVPKANVLQPMVNAPTTRPTIARFSWKAVLVASGRYKLRPNPLKKARNDDEIDDA